MRVEKVENCSFCELYSFCYNKNTIFSVGIPFPKLSKTILATWDVLGERPVPCRLHAELSPGCPPGMFFEDLLNGNLVENAMFGYFSTFYLNFVPLLWQL